MPERQLPASFFTISLFVLTGFFMAPVRTAAAPSGSFSDSIPRADYGIAPKGTYARTADGLIVYPDTTVSGNTGSAAPNPASLIAI